MCQYFKYTPGLGGVCIHVLSRTDSLFSIFYTNVDERNIMEVCSVCPPESCFAESGSAIEGGETFRRTTYIPQCPASQPCANCPTRPPLLQCACTYSSTRNTWEIRTSMYDKHMPRIRAGWWWYARPTKVRTCLALGELLRGLQENTRKLCLSRPTVCLAWTFANYVPKQRSTYSSACNTGIWCVCMPAILPRDDMFHHIHVTCEAHYIVVFTTYLADRKEVWWMCGFSSLAPPKKRTISIVDRVCTVAYKKRTKRAMDPKRVQEIRCVPLRPPRFPRGGWGTKDGRTICGHVSVRNFSVTGLPVVFGLGTAQTRDDQSCKLRVLEARASMANPKVRGTLLSAVRRYTSYSLPRSSVWPYCCTIIAAVLGLQQYMFSFSKAAAVPAGRSSSSCVEEP